jgi:PAS domain S-box-containing protein
VNPLRILLFEDPAFHAELIQTALTANNLPCEVVLVERRDDLSPVFQQQSFDVICLVDYLFPKFDELTAPPTARLRLADTPVIRVSGVSGEEVTPETPINQGVEYVPKTGLLRLASTVRRKLRSAAERKAQQQEDSSLRTGEAHYRNLFERYYHLFDNAVDSIAVCAPDGTIQIVNKQMEALVGFVRTQMIGHQYSEFVPISTQTTLKDHQRQALASEAAVISEGELVRQDGSVVPVELRSCGLRDSRGMPVGVQMFVRDISARKVAERQRADFLATLTHDIRTPITVILGYTEMLLENGKILERMRNNALSLHALVTNYLDLSRIEAGTLTPTQAPLSLNEVLRRVGDQYTPEAERRGIHVSFALQEKLPLVSGAAIALERVFVNIVTNAIKFTPRGGAITIRSELRGNEVVVTVADTGPGIPVEERATIFEKYRTVGKSVEQEGTGLGLFIVKSLVEMHNGRVAIDCPTSGGTEVIVFLPAMRV